MVLHFGIDGESLKKPLSGVGTYTLNICRALERELGPGEFKFYAYGRSPVEQVVLPSKRWHWVREPEPAWRKVPSFVWLKTRAARLCQPHRLDFFWAPRTVHPRLPKPTLTMCTVHDLNHVLVPGTMKWHSYLMHRAWFEADVRCADIVLANSKGTASRLLHHMRAPVCDVLHPGVGSQFRPLTAVEAMATEVELARLGIVRPYVLSVSTLEPRKNIDMLLRAFNLLRSQQLLPKHRLVLVGARGWQNRQLMKQLCASERVVLPGYVPDELLPAVYALADVMVFPSLYEGFGMPVLEARACGTPTVIADVPELNEAAGGDAIVVDASPEGIASGMRKALNLPHEAGMHITDFSWDKSAKRMARFIQERPMH